MRRLGGRLAVLIVTIGLIAGCTNLPRPGSDGVLRYRDEVFTDMVVTHNVQYGRAPGVNGQPEDLLLDLYQPRGDTTAKRPVIIWAHGGGFGFGDKAEGLPPIIVPKFVKRGYVAVSINYRLLAPGGCTGAGGVSPDCT